MRSRFLTSLLPVLIVSLLFAFGSAEARILNVPEDYRTIQSGIDDAQANDTVLVAPGLYQENIEIENIPVVLASHIILNWNPEIIDVTIIDGRRRGSVVTMGVNGYIVIRGFTIRNGQNDCGGGVLINYATGGVLLEDLRITNNEITHYGGGIYCADYDDNVHLRRVLLTNNNGAMFGGGISSNADTLLIEDSQIIGNSSRSDGGGIHASGRLATIRRTVVAQNTGYWNAFFFSINVNIDHLTLVDNYEFYGDDGGLFCGVEEGNYITNSILVHNGTYQMYLNGSGQSFLIDYSNLEDGQEGINYRHVDPELFECINIDPLFVDPENGDYRLAANSPCIDAGNPESVSDPDGSRADIGAIPFVPTGAWVTGRIIKSLNEEPISYATISTETGFSFLADSLGFWTYFRPGQFNESHLYLKFAALGYLSESVERLIGTSDSIFIEIELQQSRFIPSLDSLFAEVDSGGSVHLPLTITNDGDGALNWSAVRYNRGEAGLPAYTLRDSIPVGQITNDDRIEGVAFDGERFYISGANGNDSNMIYILDRDAELVDSFMQVGSTRYGYKDMDYDGTNFWAVGEDFIYSFNSEGNFVQRWIDPLNSSYHIAYDSNEGIFWLSGTTTNIVACDRQGNLLGRTLDRRGFRIYGLACANDDPDGFGLYVLNKPGDEASCVHKMNTITGDTIMVASLWYGLDSWLYQGAIICRNYDKYQGSVFITINNRSGQNGGDLLEVYQLHQNVDWISVAPESGEIPAGGEIEVTITLQSEAEDLEWCYLPGVYEGEIVFINNGEEGDIIVPVTMTVVVPDGVDLPNEVLPESIELVSIAPNPFNGQATIRFKTPINREATSLKVYGLDGRLVGDLSPAVNPPRLTARQTADRGRSAVESAVVWNAEGLPGGVYFVRLESGWQTRTMKAVLLK